MTVAIPSAEIAKLQKLMALFDSDQQGERNAAMAAATRQLQRHGVKWSEVLALAHVEVKPQDRPHREQPRRQQPKARPAPPWFYTGQSWQSVAKACRAYQLSLDQSEREFLAEIELLDHLTAEQRRRLESIAGRLRARGRAV